MTVSENFDIKTYPTPPKVNAAVHAWFRGSRHLVQDLGVDHAAIRIDSQFLEALGRHYDSLPLVDDSPKVVASYDSLAIEVDRQFFTLEQWGVRMVVADSDPYENLLWAAADVLENDRLAVLSTEVTGGHPFWSDRTNDRFRFVHDCFGHLATGRNFDRHGEEAAFRHHRTMVSPEALPALASETRGQNASLILNGEFGPQRAALMDDWAYLS